MTIKKAREILGEEAVGRTDKEIQQIIDSLTVFADIAIDTFMKMSPEERKKFVKPPKTKK